MLAVSGAIGIWVIFLLLLPWFTYSRAYIFTGGVIFVGASTALYLAWRARRANSVDATSRSRYLFFRGIGLFGIGVAWLFIAHHFLLRR